MLSVAYGIDIQEQDDPLLKAAEVSVHVADATLVPGAYLVDLFPLREFKWFFFV